MSKTLAKVVTFCYACVVGFQLLEILTLVLIYFFEVNSWVGPKEARDKVELTSTGALSVQSLTMFSSGGQQLPQSMVGKRGYLFDVRSLVSTRRLEVWVQGVILGIPAYKTHISKGCH